MLISPCSLYAAAQEVVWGSLKLRQLGPRRMFMLPKDQWWQSIPGGSSWCCRGAVTAALCGRCTSTDSSAVRDWIGTTPQRYMRFPTPSNSEWDLSWKEDCYGGNQVGMLSAEWALHPQERCPSQKRTCGHRNRHTQKENDRKTRWKDKMVIRLVGCVYNQGTPRTGDTYWQQERPGTDSPVGISEGDDPDDTLTFRLVAPEVWDGRHLWLRPPSLGILLRQP